MTKPRRDALLTAARAIATFCMGIALVICAAALIALPAVLMGHTEIITRIKPEAAATPGWEVIAALQSILALVALMGALGFQWLRKLRHVIDSVAKGDPFAPENAERLAQMGWLTVGIELLAIPVGGIGQWISRTIEDATSDFGISLGGILLALVLFILARVFREGAAMRSDLEGTV